MKRNLERPLVSAVNQILQMRQMRARQLSLAVAIFQGMQATPSQLQQVAHTAIETATNTTYAVCATLPATYDAAGYGATGLTYTAIGKMQDFPEWDLARPTGEFRPINGAVEKYDGSPNYGGGDMTIGDVVGDAGQVILRTAAFDTARAHISIKGTRPDTAIFYLDVLVTKWALSAAKENTPYLRMCHIEVCRAPVIVAAT